MYVGIANPRGAGKTFPASPVHVQPSILRIWQRPMLPFYGVSQYSDDLGPGIHLVDIVHIQYPRFFQKTPVLWQHSPVSVVPQQRRAGLPCRFTWPLLIVVTSHKRNDSSYHRNLNCLSNSLFRLTTKTSNFALLAHLRGDSIGDRWIPHTKGQ